MLNVVSDNKKASEIRRVVYTRVGLNDSENGAILQDHPQDEFLRATGRYQMCVDHIEDLGEDARPSLKKYMKGPLDLAVYNHGDELTRSMLIFEILLPKQQELLGKRKIVVADEGLASLSLAVLPFIDVFRSQIDREAERSERLIRSSKVTNLNEVKLQKDAQLVRAMTGQFMKVLSSPSRKEEPVKRPSGKEALLDVLSPSLSAQSAFYDALWNQMTEFFEPSFRYIGEQYALGRVSLESPLPFRPS